MRTVSNGPEAASRAGAINQSRSAANRARELRLGLRDGCRRHRVSQLRFVSENSDASKSTTYEISMLETAKPGLSSGRLRLYDPCHHRCGKMSLHLAIAIQAAQ